MLVESSNKSLKKQDIEKLELKALELPQVECPVYHHFGPGIYIREVHIPAGTFSIGHYQKEKHVNIMLRGRVLMLTDNGVEEVKAPVMFVGDPGRKVGYIIEDMVWQNIYATEETDIDELEKRFLEKSIGWQEQNSLFQQIEYARREIDREDYLKLLNQLGTTDTEVRAESECPDDLIDLTLPKVSVRKSPINDKGLFANAPIKKGEVIAVAVVDDKRTIVGRYTNHAKYPNAQFEFIDDDIYLRAINNIKGCEGGNQGEEITVDYRHMLRMMGADI